MAQEDQILLDRQTTYKSFIRLTTIGTLLLVLLLAVMGLTLL
jgi:Bacterial aa3 type cytochrome c oxidase subunit IV